MGCELRLVSPIPVSSNHYLAYRAVIRHGKPIGMSYCTKEAKDYKKWMTEYVKEEVKKQEWDHIPNSYQHFYVDTYFYFPRLDLDSSNYYKIMLDAITDTQLIWLDDNVACERTQRIMYDSENPRIEIYIHPVGYVGIFDNKSDLENFESTCLKCTRYSKNCSILNKAKEGRIQSDIIGLRCEKYKEIKENGKERKN